MEISEEACVIMEAVAESIAKLILLAVTGVKKFVFSLEMYFSNLKALSAWV
jgi:hypothetical protein